MRNAPGEHERALPRAPWYLVCAAGAVCVLAYVAAAAPAPADSAAVTADTAATARDSPAVSKAKGPTDTVTYEADVIRYDLQGRTVLLNGNAVTRYQDVTLRADTIMYRIDDNLFYAVGNPELTEGNDITVGDTLTYNIKTRRGSVRHATTRTSDEYFTGNRIVKSRENWLYIEDGDYTTCAYLDHPHYSFYGHHLKVIPKEKGISKPVVLNIGEAPVAVFPYFVLPLERGRRSGLLTPGWGGHPTSGGYVDNVGYYWVPNDYMDFTLAGKFKEFSDVEFTGNARYTRRYWLNGSISGRYHVGSNYRVTNQEAFLTFSHNQNLLPDASLTLRGSGNLSTARRDNKTYAEANMDRPDELLRNQGTVRANMALEKRLPRLNTSVSLAWNRDHNLQKDLINEDIPSLSFSLPNRPIIPEAKPDADDDTGRGPRWFNRIYYGYSVNGKVHRQEYLDRDTLPNYVKAGLNQRLSLSAPQTLFKYITINPTINVYHSMIHGYWDTAQVGQIYLDHDTADTVTLIHPDSTYEREDYGPLTVDTLYPSRDDPDTTVRYRRTWVRLYPDTVPVYGDTVHDWGHTATFDAGVSVSTKLYGTFPIRILGLNGIRHTLSPSVSYTYRPWYEQDKFFYPVVPFTRGQRESQSIRFSLGNSFQGRVLREPKEPGGAPEKKTFTILNVDLSTAYDFVAQKKKWSDLALSANTTLRSVGIRYNSAFWMYDGGDEGGKLTWPILRNYSIGVTPGNLAVAGRFWGGDRLVLEDLAPKDPVEYRNAGPQQWRLSISPGFSYSSTRTTPEELFTSSKNYSLNAQATLALTRNWSLSWSSRYDFVRNEFTSHSLNFRCDLECWDLVFDWTPAGVNPGYFYFRVNIKKIPDVKWEERE